MVVWKPHGTKIVKSTGPFSSGEMLGGGGGGGGLGATKTYRNINVPRASTATNPGKKAVVPGIDTRMTPGKPVKSTKPREQPPREVHVFGEMTKDTLGISSPVKGPIPGNWRKKTGGRF